MAKILITGGAGFIGSNAANYFSQQGHSVTVLDNLSLGWKSHLSEAITFVEGDVTHEKDLEKVGSVDYIIHLAASSCFSMFITDLEGSVINNVQGHIKVMEYAQKTGVKRLLFASTSSVYGNNPVPLSEDQQVYPPNMYAVSKHAQEELSRVYNKMHGLEIVAFRFMSVYGPREEHKGQFANLVSQFIWGMEQGKNPTIYGDGTQTRDFTNVRDIIQAFEKTIAVEENMGFEVLNVGTAEAIAMNDIMSILQAETGLNVAAILIENPIKTGFVKTQQADLRHVQEKIGYVPTISLQEGVREIVALRKQNPIQPRTLSF